MSGGVELFVASLTVTAPGAVLPITPEQFRAWAWFQGPKSPWGRAENGPGRRSILLVEDDADMAAMYRWRLEQAGFDVTVVRDGVEAMTVAQTLVHDLIVMDIGLPRQSGLEVIRLLRNEATTQQVPIVVLSNYSEPEMIRLAHDFGVLAYLVKADVTPTQLARRIKDWFSN